MNFAYLWSDEREKIIDDFCEKGPLPVEITEKFKEYEAKAEEIESLPENIDLGPIQIDLGMNCVCRIGEMINSQVGA